MRKSEFNGRREDLWGMGVSDSSKWLLLLLLLLLPSISVTWPHQRESRRDGTQSASRKPARAGSQWPAGGGREDGREGWTSPASGTKKSGKTRPKLSGVHVCILVCANMCAYRRSAVAGEMKQDSGSRSAPSRLLPAASRFQK